MSPVYPLPTNHQDYTDIISASIINDLASALNTIRGTGTLLLNYTPLSLEVANGTAAVPLTTPGPSVRISRTENPSSAFGGNSVDNSSNACLVATSVGLANSAMQTAAVRLQAQGSSSPDSVGILSLGQAVAGTGRGTGGYLEGRRDVATAKTISAELRSNNATATPGVFSGSQASDTVGLWLTAGGNSNSAEAIGIGGVGVRWLYGISFKSSLGPLTAGISDSSSAIYSYTDVGTHTVSFNIAPASAVFGIDFNGGTFSSGAIRLGYGSGIWSRNSTSNGDVNVLYVTHVAGVDQVISPSPLYLLGPLTLNGGILLGTSAALTDGAAALTATLTNSPKTGNPTKWVPIIDNGVTRYIPMW